MESSAVFITLETNEEVDVRKNMGLLHYVLKCVSFHFPGRILSSCHCPPMINANTLDMDLSSILFNVPPTTPTLLNKVLRSLSFHSSHILFNTLSAWVYPKICCSWQYKKLCWKEYLSWFVRYAILCPKFEKKPFSFPWWFQIYWLLSVDFTALQE